MRTFTSTEAPSLAWRTKNFLFTDPSINQAEWFCKRKNRQNTAAWMLFDMFYQDGRVSEGKIRDGRGILSFFQLIGLNTAIPHL